MGECPLFCLKMTGNPKIRASKKYWMNLKNIIYFWKKIFPCLIFSKDVLPPFDPPDYNSYPLVYIVTDTARIILELSFFLIINDFLSLEKTKNSHKTLKAYFNINYTHFHDHIFHKSDNNQVNREKIQVSMKMKSKKRKK